MAKVRYTLLVLVVVNHLVISHKKFMLYTISNLYYKSDSVKAKSSRVQV